jgi:riboflavin biosynthesis pyrimidine reductase
VRALLPEPTGELDDLGLAAHYAEPLPALDAGGWLRANMVASVDGAATLHGTSAGLGSPADQRLLGVLRALADVVLVGASTVRVEQYGPTRPRSSLLELRRERGQKDTARLAIVSGRLDLDPGSELFTQAQQRPLVLTHAAAPADAVQALSAVAEVLTCGEQAVDLTLAVTELRRRNLARMLTEGGPHLLAQLVTAGVVDEVSVTVSPQLVGAGPPRILAGPPGGASGGAESSPTSLTLAGILVDDDMLFARYVRQERS